MAELISTMSQIALTNGCVIKFEAIDPTTGAAITGVKIKNPVVYGFNLLGTEDDTAPKLPDVAPIFVPIETSLPEDEPAAE
jgi:hypothetical protein